MKICKQILILFLITVSEGIFSQSTVLDQYINVGIQNNPGLKQQNFALQKSLYLLKEAKSLFFPNVNFNTSYSTATGGRQISFPVGDLVNPIYDNLNKINPPGSPKYPAGAVPNVNEQLVPKNFYDARLKTQMPIYNAEIKYNKLIKKELLSVQQAEIEVYRLELKKDIKIAYFNYLKTIEAINIYENAKNLLKETERVNRSLIKNDMANNMVLTRTQNEQAKVEAEAINAENNRQNAQAYFNFLLCQPFETAVLVDTSFKNLKNMVLPENPTIENREELQKFRAGIKVNENILSMNKAFNKPKIGGILDVGSQGKISDINGQNPFLIFGISFDLPVYAGNRNKLKIKAQEMELAALNEQEIHVKNQLLLQAELTKNSFENAIKIIPAKNSQVTTAYKYYTHVLKKYKEGQINYVELYEAQSQITTALLQKNIAIYDSWIKFAEYERGIGND